MIMQEEHLNSFICICRDINISEHWTHKFRLMSLRCICRAQQQRSQHVRQDNCSQPAWALSKWTRRQWAQNGQAVLTGRDPQAEQTCQQWAQNGQAVSTGWDSQEKTEEWQLRLEWICNKDNKSYVDTDCTWDEQCTEHFNPSDLC